MEQLQDAGRYVVLWLQCTRNEHNEQVQPHGAGDCRCGVRTVIMDAAAGWKGGMSGAPVQPSSFVSQTSHSGWPTAADNAAADSPAASKLQSSCEQIKLIEPLSLTHPPAIRDVGCSHSLAWRRISVRCCTPVTLIPLHNAFITTEPRKDA